MRIIFLLSLLASLSCNNASRESSQVSSDAPSWAMLGFKKADDVNPIMTADQETKFFCPIRHQSLTWQTKNVFNPAAVVKSDTVYLLYRAQDSVGKPAGTSRIGIAWSTDGLSFTRNPSPVLFPENDSLKKYEWEGGCEDPRIVEDETGTYYLTYTAFDGEKARLMIATSRDLFHWTKRGRVFAASYNGEYADEWSKSGAIICKYENGKAVAVKIGKKYWMYWGDTDIFLASSEDLIHWVPAEGSDGKLLSIIKPRSGKFDSYLVESGPPAMLTDRGVLLIYNGRNNSPSDDANLPAGTYTAAEVLLDPNDPSKVLERMDNYFLKPEKPYEVSGQVDNVCFMEGLVQFKGRWYMYYGTADSRIAVAVK